MYLTKIIESQQSMPVIKPEQLIFTHQYVYKYIMHTYSGCCFRLWHCVNRKRYVTPEQSIGNDAVQSLITGSRENREFTHGRFGLALGRRLEL